LLLPTGDSRGHTANKDRGDCGGEGGRPRVRRLNHHQPPPYPTNDMAQTDAAGEQIKAQFQSFIQSFDLGGDGAGGGDDDANEGRRKIYLHRLYLMHENEGRTLMVDYRHLHTVRKGYHVAPHPSNPTIIPCCGAGIYLDYRLPFPPITLLLCGNGVFCLSTPQLQDSPQMAEAVAGSFYRFSPFLNRAVHALMAHLYQDFDANKDLFVGFYSFPQVRGDMCLANLRRPQLWCDWTKEEGPSFLMWWWSSS